MENKLIVVTGAAGGQGAAEAAALAAEGAVVVATDVHEKVETGPGISYRRLDVSKPDDWQALAEWLRSEHGRLDGLVNNAGIPLRARVDEVELVDWNRVLGVNLTGTLLGIQAAAALMTDGGSIVNVSSVAGLTGYHGVAYTASKWAVRGLSRAASAELGPRGIRVNTIFPGFIDTPMTASAPEEFRDANIAQTPLGRAGRADEVAPLVVFLLSDESSFLTGAEIAVDGGQVAHGGAYALSEAVRHPA